MNKTLFYSDRQMNIVGNHAYDMFSIRSFADPLIAYDNNCLIFYNEVNENVIEYNHQDDMYDDLYDDAFNINYMISEGEINGSDYSRYKIRNPIPSVFYIVQVPSTKTYIYPSLYIDKENFYNSIVIKYPFGNIYDSEEMCWGNVVEGRIGTISEWFQSIHNNDLYPSLFFSDIKKHPDRIADYAYDDEGIIESVYRYISHCLEELYNIINNLMENNAEDIKERIVAKAYELGFEPLLLRETRPIREGSDY